MTLRPIRSCSVRVDGDTDALRSARPPGKARAAAYLEFSAACTKTFRELLAIARARRVVDPPGIGKRIIVAGLPATRIIVAGLPATRIIVAGLPATRCSGRGDRSVRLMRDDGDVPMCPHPADARPMPQHIGAAPC